MDTTSRHRVFRDKPLPQFGRNDGGWFAAFADGTVKQLATYNDERTIRNLLTIG